ncbi:hypothetical protein [Pseudothauera rhizosphaerae]|uniref:hypothetical protein n=1 Tax=Pseudothauera rhizosphaerae TaxID=2565932 RepID=UPI001454DDFD|nr:hypothetical protein [Pseudothauera rhizosphaerae]
MEKQHDDESRIDFRQMLEELESEGAKPVLKDVRQDDISQLFKKKKRAEPPDSESQ